MRGFLLMAYCLFAAGAQAGVGEWKTHTPKKEVRGAAATGGVLWAATAGGLFAYDSESGAYATFTTSEGLRSIDLTALTADSSGILWIGSSDGMLHRFRPAVREWTYISDISLLNASRKRINAIEVWGDSLIVLSDVGISVYSISRSEFGDSYLRFGNAPGVISGTVTGAARYAGRIWASTGSGVVSTPASNPNPTEPSSWQAYGTAEGLPSPAATSLLVARDSLYVSTAAGIAVWNGTGWRAVEGSQSLNVLGLASPGGGCEAALFVTPSSVGALDQAGAARILSSPAGLTLSCVAPGGYIGTMNAGALRYEACPAPGDSAGIVETALPPGPHSGKFVSVAVDEGGWVWAATGNRDGEGFMSFNGTAWRSYNAGVYPELLTNDYYVVSAGPGNVKYIGGWGPGLVVVNAANEIERVLNTSNGLQPSVETFPFVVVGGVATDRDGVAWLTPRTPTGDTTLVKLSPGGGLDYVTGCMYELPDSSGVCKTRSPLRVLTDVVIDDFGTKWFANYGRFETVGPTGLYYYNETRNLPGTRGGWGKLTELDGLPGNQVWSVAVDRFGDIWVGSNPGISIIYSPTNPKASFAPYRPLPDQIIQDILVDPLNRKWVATKRGVFLLSQDGTDVLEHYTVGSTGGMLLDDDVASIALDGRTGIVYFGTEKGLSSLSTPAVTPDRSFAELKIYPNPFEIPAASPVTVDGLVAGSSLKVFTVDGALVKAVDSPGGRVGFWDGTDGRGAVVSSGVYVVVAYSEDGTEVGSAKIAVIRK
ncbi:MAG TPA: two-component regulator propeller domain-containing protein [Bacteroidota bacterium]|nr:two-component regulator propeller domain-containing protein [Bacteroidota bacterium]